MEFKASYLEIEPRELVQYLLRETGQEVRDVVNPMDFLDFLKLDFELFDFDSVLPADARGGHTSPRALLSFPERLVAAHSNLNERRQRFSILHEVAHYVLPSHQHTLYLCDEAGMGLFAKLTLEREANEFAANLLFQGDRFTLEANSQPVSALTVKRLAEKYEASYESTARRLIERNLRECMLVIFEKDGPSRVDTDTPPLWRKKYCVASSPFGTRHFADLHRESTVDQEIASRVTAPLRDIADTVVCEVTITGAGEQGSTFNAEFFFNQYNIFCILTPLHR